MILNAAGMDKTFGTYVDDACFDIHDNDDDTDHDIDDDVGDDIDGDTNDDTDNYTDDGGRGNLYPISRLDTGITSKMNLYPIKAAGSRALSGHE